MKMENQFENQVPPVVGEPAPNTPQPNLGFLTFDGRMNRRSYIVNALVNFFCMLLIAGISFAIHPALGAFVFFIVFIIYFLRSLVILLRRVHDLGYSGYWILAVYGISLLISIVSAIMYKFYETDLYISDISSLIFTILQLYVLFWPGQKFENKYGPVPEKKIVF